MSTPEHVVELRVRYSETDQMGTFYNSRVLDWFEVGRTELMRSLDLPYAEVEHKGIHLPLVEAHVNFLGRARYDDLLAMTCRAGMVGRARVRFDAAIELAGSKQSVAAGHTVHAITDTNGRPVRPPAWLADAFGPYTE